MSNKEFERFLDENSEFITSNAQVLDTDDAVRDWLNEQDENEVK